MSGTHPPDAKVHILPSYCNPSSCEEEDTDDKRMKWDKGPSPVSPFEHGPPSPVSPRYAQKMDKDDCEEGDKYDSEDDKPLKRPESPPPSKRQYSCKLDKDGVLRYRPAPDDYKPKSPTKHVEPYPTPSQLNKREAPEEWPEDEDKCEAQEKKAKKGAQEDLKEEDDIPALTLCLAFCKDEVKKHKAREDKAKKDKARRDKAKKDKAKKDKTRRSLDKAMDEV